MTSCRFWNAGNASANWTGSAAPANGPKKRASKPHGRSLSHSRPDAAACADFSARLTARQTDCPETRPALTGPLGLGLLNGESRTVLQTCTLFTVNIFHIAYCC